MRISGTRLSIMFVALLGLIVSPFDFVSSGLPQATVNFQDSAGRGQGNEEEDLPGQGDESRADPCKHRKHAEGHDKKCRRPGSSGGVAKGDFNGDGIGDLAMGVPGESVGTAQGAGAVNIIYGSVNGLTTTDPTVPASQFWSQNSPLVPDDSESGDGFGQTLAAGDFNGDKFSDLAISVPGEDFSDGNDQEAIHILYGSAHGLTVTDPTVPASQFLRSSLVAPGASFVELGPSLVWADFNGDGFADLAVEILVSSDNFGTLSDEKVVIFQGSAQGLNANDFQMVDFFTGDFGAGVGLVLAAGDFNGDRFADLAAGAPQEDFPVAPSPGNILVTSGPGAVHVIYGSAAGLSPTAGPDIQLWTQDSPGIEDIAEANDRFGAALAVGDFNGDTYADLAIGVPGESIGTIGAAGAVNVIYGSVKGLTATGNQFWHQDSPGILDKAEAADLFGQALAAADFNGDKFTDLAVGVPNEDLDTIADAGAVSIIYGSAPGLTAGAGTTGVPANQFWHQNSSGIEDTSENFDFFGASLTAWNFGKGSQADLAIGVPFEDVKSTTGEQITNAGLVNVIYGSTTGLTATDNQVWHQGISGVRGTLEANDFFGNALY